jgi:hypothetical protein
MTDIVITDNFIKETVKEAGVSEPSIEIVSTIIENSILTYFIASKSATFQELVDYTISLMPNLHLMGDKQFALAGRRFGVWGLVDMTDIEDMDDPEIRAIMLSVCVLDENREIDLVDSRNLKYLQEHIKNIKHPFFSAQAGMAFAEDGNTRIGFHITDNIGNSILTVDFNDINTVNFSISSKDCSDERSQKEEKGSGGCYIATAIYGSYDCPQVWTLRRYRDQALRKTIPGQWFIKIYYAISPTLVRWFGNTGWFHRIVKNRLDRWIGELENAGYENTPYED